MIPFALLEGSSKASLFFCSFTCCQGAQVGTWLETDTKLMSVVTWPGACPWGAQHIWEPALPTIPALFHSPWVGFTGKWNSKVCFLWRKHFWNPNIAFCVTHLFCVHFEDFSICINFIWWFTTQIAAATSQFSFHIVTKGPSALAVFHSIPRPLAGNSSGSGAAGTQRDIHIGCLIAGGSGLTSWATTLALPFHFTLKSTYLWTHRPWTYKTSRVTMSYLT